MILIELLGSLMCLIRLWLFLFMALKENDLSRIIRVWWWFFKVISLWRGVYWLVELKYVLVINYWCLIGWVSFVDVELFLVLICVKIRVVLVGSAWLYYLILSFVKCKLVMIFGLMFWLIIVILFFDVKVWMILDVV